MQPELGASVGSSVSLFMSSLVSSSALSFVASFVSFSNVASVRASKARGPEDDVAFTQHGYSRYGRLVLLYPGSSTCMQLPPSK